MRPALALPCLVLLAALPAGGQSTSVRLLHFSDYHSHAVPFFSEGAADQAGIARGVALFAQAKARPGTFVLSGGDMLNEGVPAWSDEHGCAEWPWLLGLVDAMALGNHDLATTAGPGSSVAARPGGSRCWPRTSSSQTEPRCCPLRS